jgi:hypothetical protein
MVKTVSERIASLGAVEPELLENCALCSAFIGRTLGVDKFLENVCDRHVMAAERISGDLAHSMAQQVAAAKKSVH